MIHLFYGEETYLLRKELEKLQKSVLSDKSSDFNRDLLDGKSCSAEEIIRCSETIPMLGGKRLVIVSDAHSLKKGELDKIQEWLSRLPDSTELVFVAEKIDRRIKFWQGLIDQGHGHEFNPIKPRSAPAWIADESMKRGKKISKDAAFFMASALGTDLGILDSAIEKIFLYVGNVNQIGLADVEACVSDISAKSIFELTDAIGEKNRKRCFDLISRIDTARGNVLGVLAMIVRHFRILIKARAIMDSGRPETDMAKRLGVPHYFVQGYIAQAGNFSADVLKRSFGKLYETDRALKSSPLASGVVIEKLIWDLTAS